MSLAFSLQKATVFVSNSFLMLVVRVIYMPVTNTLAYFALAFLKEKKQLKC
jgi:hypothetical protein